MTRFLIPSLLICLAASACGGPVETRVQTQMASPLPSQKQFSFSATAEQENEAYKIAQNLISESLKARGFEQGDFGGVLINIALAERPASIAITTGENEETRPVVNQKEKKPLQSCDDREHRLTILMLDSSNGGKIYSGTAAEYHCKGTIEQSLPHLVEAAMSNFGSEPSQTAHTGVHMRTGIE